MIFRLRTLTLVPLLLVGCENPIKRAAREVAYSGYEMIGVQKRDLLKRYVDDTKKAQQEASESFEDSLDKLRKLYAMPESRLASNYKEVRASYERSNTKAKAVRSDREKMQTTARDLFREWKNEIDQIGTPDLKVGSRRKLRDSEAKFERLDRSLDSAQRKMDSVLARLNDNVLYLKHNLNAESLSSLGKERDRIASDISALVADMNKAIARADDMIGAMR